MQSISALQSLAIIRLGLAQQAAVLQVLDGRLQPLLKTGAAYLFEITVDGVPSRHRELGEWIVHLVQLELAALGELHGAADHFGRMREKPLHLLGGLHIKLIGVEFEALRVMDRACGLDAQQHFVRMVIVLAQIVAVIGCHQRDAEFLLHTEHVRMDLLFEFQPLILNFEEEIPFPKDVLIARGHIARGLILARHQVFAKFACQAAGEADQPARMLGEIALRDARLAIEAVQRGFRGNAYQVAVAFLVLR